MPLNLATTTAAVMALASLTAVTAGTLFSEHRPAAQGRQAAARLDSITCAMRGPATATEVAVLDFRGGIQSAFASDRVYGLLNEIAGDERIGAVALRIDSAGGDSYSSKKLYEAVKKLKTACRLPMAAFVGNVATSGGFWLAMAADEVHADTLSTVGAVGVMAIYANEVKKLEKDGISQTVIRTGERKWPLMPYVPVAEDDVRKVRASLELVLGEFATAVEEARRGKSKLARAELVTGEAWMGAEAHVLGLVDGPAEVDGVMARLAGGEVRAYRQFDLAAAAGGTAAGGAASAPMTAGVR